MLSHPAVPDLPDDARALPGRQFRLRCSDVHPVRCGVALGSSDVEDLVSQTRAHGANAHGFTPAWYSPQRIAAIAAAAAH
jgi:hypothetical protein